MFEEISLPLGNPRQKKTTGKKWGAKETHSQKNGLDLISEKTMNHLKNDKALKKTITYRIAVGILGAGLVWVATGNIFATAGISVSTEVMRTAVYYAHEKAYESKGKNAA